MPSCKNTRVALPRPTRRILRLGLTRMEVALIIAAVALFFVILMPVGSIISTEREKKHRVNCAGNLKQIGLGALMYSGDCAGYFMTQTTAASCNLEPLNSAALLPDGKVYACPSAREARTLCRYSNYRYRGSELKDDNDSATCVSLDYDQSGNHSGNRWMSVLFMDGHVEGAPADGSKGWNLTD